MTDDDRAILLRVESKIDEFLAMLERFKPYLEQYEQAAKAKTMFGKHKAMKGVM